MTTKRNLLIALMLSTMAFLPSCRTNPNRSPGGTVFGSTTAGAGLGALIGLAAGDAGAGAAIGAGVGLIAGAIQADEDAQARDEYHTYGERRVVVRETTRTYLPPEDEYLAQQDRARDLLNQGQRAPNLYQSKRLLKRSLREYRTPEAHTALGEIYEQEGNVALAQSEYERALDLDQNYRPAQDNLSAMGR